MKFELTAGEDRLYIVYVVRVFVCMYTDGGKRATTTPSPYKLLEYNT